MLNTQFDAGTTKVVDGFGDEQLGARVLMGTRKDDRLTMVAFRGTNNLVDTARDATMGCLDAKGHFNLDSASSRGLGAGAVHKGFADHLDTVWKDLRADILGAARAGRTVDITGHSLGAATAALAMARAINDPEIRQALQQSKAQPPAILETFAQPSVGDAAFETQFKQDLDALGIPFHTYGFRDDPVMQMPPSGMPDGKGRTFARPSGTFIHLDTGPNGATQQAGRPPETVKQDIRVSNPAVFAQDAAAFARSAGDALHGYSKLADHAPQNYFEALRQLWKAAPPSAQ